MEGTGSFFHPEKRGDWRGERSRDPLSRLCALRPRLRAPCASPPPPQPCPGDARSGRRRGIRRGVGPRGPRQCGGARVEEEALLGSDPDSVLCSGPGTGGLGRLETAFRWAMGRWGAREHVGKTENARVPVFCPQLLIAALSFLSGPGEEESGRLGEAGHPPPHPLASLGLFRPLSPSFRIPTTPSSPDLFLLPLRGGPQGRPQGGSRTALRGQTLCLSASPFCVKLREKGGVGDPQPPRTFPKPRHPGRSRAPSDSPGEGEGPREQKPRHLALASPGARWSGRHRASRLTPFPALRGRPGGGWGAAGDALAAPRKPSSSPPPPITSEAGSFFSRLQSPCGKNTRRVRRASGKGRGGWRGCVSSPLLCIKRGVCRIEARPLPWQRWAL